MRIRSTSMIEGPGTGSDGSFRELACALKPDISLGSHGSFFNLSEKVAALKNGAKDAFVDPAGYRAFVETMEKQFEARVTRERR